MFWSVAFDEIQDIVAQLFRLNNSILAKTFYLIDHPLQVEKGEEGSSLMNFS
jgi:hypothetical protein